MPVWTRPVRPLVNVFWLAMMTVAAKPVVYQLSKTNIPNAPVRFLESI